MGSNQEIVCNCVAEEFGNIPSPNAGDSGVISRRQGWNLFAICERKLVRSEPGDEGVRGLACRKWKPRQASVWYCSVDLGSSGGSHPVVEMSTTKSLCLVHTHLVAFPSYIIKG